MPSVEEIDKAGEENMGSEEAYLTEKREKLIDQIKTDARLDGLYPETVDQMIESFNIDGEGGFSFTVDGHKITGTTESFFGLPDYRIDYDKLSPIEQDKFNREFNPEKLRQGGDLNRKYGKTVEAICRKLSNANIYRAN